MLPCGECGDLGTQKSMPLEIHRQCSHTRVWRGGGGHLSALDSNAQDLALGTGVFWVGSQNSGRHFAFVGLPYWDRYCEVYMKTRRESWDEALPATCSALWAVTVSDILTSSEKALWHSVLARVSVVVIKHHDQNNLWKKFNLAYNGHKSILTGKHCSKWQAWSGKLNVYISSTANIKTERSDSK